MGKIPSQKYQLIEALLNFQVVHLSIGENIQYKIHKYMALGYLLYQDRTYNYETYTQVKGDCASYGCLRHEGSVLRWCFKS